MSFTFLKLCKWYHIVYSIKDIDFWFDFGFSRARNLRVREVRKHVQHEARKARGHVRHGAYVVREQVRHETRDVQEYVGQSMIWGTWGTWGRRAHNLTYSQEGHNFRTGGNTLRKRKIIDVRKMRWDFILKWFKESLKVWNLNQLTCLDSRSHYFTSATNN